MIIEYKTKSVIQKKTVLVIISILTNKLIEKFKYSKKQKCVCKNTIITISINLVQEVN